MTRTTRFFALPRADRGLLLEAMATVVMVRLALHLVAIERLRSWAARRATHTAAATEAAPVDRIAWAGRAATRAVPGTKCLASAFALQRLLSRQGYASKLHIGVARINDAFSAHAWLVCDGEILVGEDGHEAFTPLTAWPSIDKAGRG